jgi:hypothetical protein
MKAGVILSCPGAKRRTAKDLEISVSMKSRGALVEDAFVRILNYYIQESSSGAQIFFACHPEPAQRGEGPRNIRECEIARSGLQ